MDGSVIRLYPGAAETCAIRGLYLSHDLRNATPRSPVVYTNFVVSLDGRISEPDPATGLRRVPKAIANPYDRRLFMELLAQCDALLIGARHARAVACGRHGDMLSINEEEFPDLAAWRRERNLPSHPTCAVISSDLEFPIAEFVERHPAPLLALATAQSSPRRIQEIEALGGHVLTVGAGPRLDGGEVINALARRGLNVIYSVAGPKVLHTLLHADALDRLYLTVVQVVLGGTLYDTLCTGQALIPPRQFKLDQSYLDSTGAHGGGQMFATFTRDDSR